MSVFDGVRVGDFKLHSGGSSPVLFDVPSMLAAYADRHYIQNTLIQKMPRVPYEYIVGVDFGGALLAVLLGEWYTDKHIGFYRKSGEIVGLWPSARCVLIDDVTTTGASLDEAANALTAAGHAVVGKVALIRREGAQHGD